VLKLIFMRRNEASSLTNLFILFYTYILASQKYEQNSAVVNLLQKTQKYIFSYFKNYSSPLPSPLCLPDQLSKTTRAAENKLKTAPCFSRVLAGLF